MSDSDSDSGKNRGMFHRSVSMSTGAPWARNSSDGRVVMMRKRNNSSSELSNGNDNSYFLVELFTNLLRFPVKYEKFKY